MGRTLYRHPLVWVMEKPSGIFTLAACLMGLTTSSVQAVSVLSTEATLYTEAGYAESEGEGDPFAGLGSSGEFEYAYLVGPHHFNSGYLLRLIAGYEGNAFWRSRLTGSSRYQFTHGSGLFDLNGMHILQSVNPNPGFILDPEGFTTEHILSAGSGVNLSPGDVTRIRLETQYSRSLHEDESLNGEILEGRGVLTRRLNPISEINTQVSRTIVEEGDPAQVSQIDRATVGYRRTLDNGELSASFGVNLAETEQTDVEVYSGSMERVWVSDYGRTSIGYDREVTNTLLELTTENIVPEATDQDLQQEETIKLNSLALNDELRWAYQTVRACIRCDLSMSASLSQQENLDTGIRSVGYDGRVAFLIRIDDTQESQLSYRWQAESPEFGEVLLAESNRIEWNWSRQVTEHVSFRSDVSQAWISNDVDSSRFTIRISGAYRWGPDQ
ncbi:hypothetical protein [Saccharospirillum salsuginis]|uniref:Uncharacterized protein n=1 Tax=Saccharospirillum salsuginis TaxID=418750 RepID=A0A918N823_9GAMM|nr:hypothetical protein [Saccharospirillum salsuginis]GGX49531.1 hypothetical protein GCM10007392_16070 [Saccharospirillum salsuginis]